jgi:beta-lactamase regulating signal transducer with metallopeptidase domain
LTAEQVLDHLLRTCWQGSLVLLLVWGVCRLFPRLPASAKTWLWRLAYLKLVVSLFAWQAVELQVLAPTYSSPAVTGSAIDQPHVSVSWWLLAPWALWFVAYSACTLAATLRVKRALAVARHIEAPELAELCHALGVRRAPKVLVSTRVDSAVLVGGLSYAILLPEAVPAEDRRLMLAHELAHLRRADVCWNWLPFAAHAAYGLCPLLWLAARCYHLARECACDELAIKATGVTPRVYGSMLFKASIARHALEPAAIGLTSRYGLLKARISALGSRQHASVAQIPIAGAAGLVVVALMPAWKLTAPILQPPLSWVSKPKDIAVGETAVANTVEEHTAVAKKGNVVSRAGLNRRLSRRPFLVASKPKPRQVQNATSSNVDRGIEAPPKQPPQKSRETALVAEEFALVQRPANEAKPRAGRTGDVAEAVTFISQPGGKKTEVVSGKTDIADEAGAKKALTSAPPKKG